MKKILIISLIISAAPTVCKLSLEPVYNLFGKYSHQKVEQYYFDDPVDSLIIANDYGDTSIKTWKNKKICVRSIIKAGKTEELSRFSLEKKGEKNQYAFTITCPEKTKGCYDMELMVPDHVRISFNGKGAFSLSGLNAPIQVLNEGNTSIDHCQGTITVQTNKQGSIYLRDIDGNIRATSVENITISNAQKSIIAFADGSIKATCSSLPTTSKLHLNAQKNIILSLPSSLDAHLRARTDRGTITSQIPLLIKPFPMVLNDQAWRRLKKEIEGVFGTGEAEIQTICKNGSIKILEIPSSGGADRA